MSTRLAVKMLLPVDKFHEAYVRVYSKWTGQSRLAPTYLRMRPRSSKTAPVRLQRRLSILFRSL